MDLGTAATYVPWEISSYIEKKEKLIHSVNASELMQMEILLLNLDHELLRQTRRMMSGWKKLKRFILTIIHFVFISSDLQIGLLTSVYFCLSKAKRVKANGIFLWSLMKMKKQWGWCGTINFLFLDEQSPFSCFLLQCAEAALHSNLGKHLETYFVGNAPCGHLENSETNTKVLQIFFPAVVNFFYCFIPFVNFAIQVFFFRSQILGGNLKLNQQLKDYAWVTKEQITDFIEPQHLDFFNKLLI